MKKLLIIIVVTTLFFSCRQEDSSADGVVQKGIPTQVRLPFNIAEPEFAGELPATTTVASKSSKVIPFSVTYTVPVKGLQTKAVSSFSNVWVLQFNSNACVVATNLGTVTTGTNLNPTLITGTNQTIYIVANGPSAADAFNAGMTQTDFEESLTYTGSIAGDAQVPYVGNLTGVTVADGSLTSGSSLSPVITLSRIAAKVSLALDYNVSGYTLQSVEMYNAAKNMYYVLGKDVTTFPVTPSSANINQSALPANIIPGTATSGTYIWYVGENKRGTGSITSPYQKDFLHTPGSSYYCTYIRIKSLKNDGSGQVLNYYLYPGENGTTDFNVKRNWDYNLNVAIQGNAAAQESCEGVDGRVRMATSNAYIVAPGSTITIPVNIKGNANEPLKEAPTDNATIGGVTHTATSVAVLWQSATSLINVSSIYNGKVNITASSTPGNAVVAAYNGSTIVWSWHIWVTDYTPSASSVTNGVIYSFNNRTWMDRNLGATTATPATVTTFGLLYQWGRKDPFPGCSDLTAANNTYGSISIYNANQVQLTEGAGSTGTGIKKIAVSAANNLLNAIQNPLIFYYGTSGNDYDWYSSTASIHKNDLWGGASTSTPTSKTIYDPCPAGWRVPAWSSDISPWNGLTINNGAWNIGWDWSAISAGYYPVTGVRYYTCGEFYYVGEYGCYWSASVNGSSAFYFDNCHSYVYPTGNLSRSYGYGVRCCKE